MRVAIPFKRLEACYFLDRIEGLDPHIFQVCFYEGGYPHRNLFSIVKDDFLFQEQKMCL